MPPAIAPAPFRAMVQSLLDHLARHGVARRVQGPLLALIWNHIRAIECQVLGLLARLEAGTLRRFPARRRPAPGRPRRAPPPRRLPHGPLWLVRLVNETAYPASWLDRLLQHPDVPELLRQAPQLRRALRPLCTMLGVPLPAPAPPSAPQPPSHPPAPHRPAPHHPPPPPFAHAGPPCAAPPLRPAENPA